MRASSATSAASSVPRNTRFPSTATPRLYLIASGRVAHLLLASILPDLQTGLGIEREHLPGSAGGVHDAVDYERCRFEPVTAARQLDRPSRLKLPDARSVHLFQRGVVPSLIVAPVGEPVLRLGGGVQQAVIGDAAGDFGLNGLREIPSSLRAEIRHQTLDFGLGKTLCEISGHEGFWLDGCAREIPLIESQQFAAGVGDDQRKCIFRAPDAADLLAVLGSRDHGTRPTAAARIRIGVGIYDFLT